MAVIVENAASRIPISHESGTSGSAITPSPLEQQEISTVGSVPTQERNSNTNESSSSSPSESQPPALPSSEARLGQIDMLLASFGVGLMAVGLTFGLSKYSFDAFLIGSLTIIIIYAVLNVVNCINEDREKIRRQREQAMGIWQGTRGSNRDQRGVNVIRMSRDVYDRMDPELLQLILSNRELDSNDYEQLLRLDQFNHDKSCGASESDIYRLPIIQVTEQMLKAIDTSECTICLVKLELEEKIRMLPCFHHFHPECIDPWLRQNGTCPICKIHISNEDPIPT